VENRLEKEVQRITDKLNNEMALPRSKIEDIVRYTSQEVSGTPNSHSRH